MSGREPFRGAEELLLSRLPPQGGTLIAAVSGGLDSMSLLHFLKELAPKRGYTLYAAHFEHGIRGESSRADADFVRKTCAAWGVSCRIGHGDVPAEAKRRGETLEEAARHLRYAFLEETAAAVHADLILTAHHAEDNAETLLLNLVRGTANAGLAGIAPERGIYLRPLLSLTKEELRTYAAAHGVPHREDETNGDVRFSRNRLRLRVFPELREINPDAVGALNRAIRVSRGENGLLTELARSALGAVARRGDCVSVPLARFYAADERLWMRMLSLLLDETHAGRKDFSAAHLEALAALIAGGRGHLDLPSRLGADVRGGAFTFSVRTETPAPAVLREGEGVRFGGYEIRLQKCQKLSAEGGSAITLSRAMIKMPLTVDVPRSGAGLRLAGAPGKRSVKRLLSDLGLPPEERRVLPVIYSDGVPVAAARLGADTACAWDGSGDAIEIIFKKREESAT